MDDSLERPDAKPPAIEDGEAGSDDDGDVVLDWTKLAPSAARPVIPRRGEKEFEPHPGGGSGLQVHVLDRARNAMFDALSATRTISSKVISYAMWHPQISRAHVILARGTHYNSLGHSIPHPVYTEDGTKKKTQKRLELLPEEALYLVERGSAFCWKETELDLTQVEAAERVLGAPMSVQQAYTEMIGSEDLTLERYQVYAYLKRLGYVVTRTTPPNADYPIPPPFDLSPLNPKPISFLDRIRALFPTWITRLLTPRINWWRPLQISKWSFYGRNYGAMFSGLRFLRSGHSVPLLVPRKEAAVGLPTPSSPYRIFFNVHKPATSYRKTSPCLPDYQIVVVNARTTPMPSLGELTDLFDVSPELPPPLPRQRRPGKATPQPITAPASSAPWTKRLLDWLYNKPRKYVPPPRRAHPFMVMKAGKKTVIIAVVDAGNIGFFRFGQGAFEEMPLA